MEAYRHNRGQQNIYETDGSAARKVTDFRTYSNAVTRREVNPAEWRRENRPVRNTYRKTVRKEQKEEYEEAARLKREALQRRREEEEQQRREAEKAARNRAIPKLANDVSFGSMILLVAAVCVTLYVCLGYLKVQANIVVTNKAITKLETELSDLRTRNEAAYNMVVDAVDFEEVYKTAVTELGMVFPYKNKVVTYSVDPSGYVRQFKEIPRADLVNAIKELLPFE